jgi:Integrase zinc binding domain
MSFIIKTDHISLKHLFEQHLTHSLQHKELRNMLDLDYTIQYKRCLENHVAGALSRRDRTIQEGKIMTVTEVNPQWIEDLKVSYEEDSWIQQVLTQYVNGLALPTFITIHSDSGVIRKKEKLYVGNQPPWKSQMIQTLHDFSVGGHSGILGTYQRVKRAFIWPSLKADVLTHVQHCNVCQMNKGAQSYLNLFQYLVELRN